MKSNNSINVPQARQAMDQFKQQAASEEGRLCDYRNEEKITPEKSKNIFYTYPNLLKNGSLSHTGRRAFFMP